MRQVYRILQRPADLAADDPRKVTSKIVRDSLMTKIFSLQLFVGYHDDSQGHFNIPGKVAWVTLNLKNIATCLAQTVSPKDPARADGIVSLRHVARWCIDLVVMILADLAEIQRWRQSRPSDFDRAELIDYISKSHHRSYLNERVTNDSQGNSNSPSVFILLSASPRSLLRMVLELIRIYFGKAMQTSPQTAAQRALVQEIITYSKLIPFKIPNLESLMQEVDTSIRTAYKTAELAPQARVDAETTMLVDAMIPECLETTVEYLTGKVATRMLDTVDTGKITFWETDWLGLRDREGEDGRAQRRRYDAIQKMGVREGMKLRTCRRCGSVMEDVYFGAKGSVPPWLAQAQRFCVCLGYWMLKR